MNFLNRLKKSFNRTELVIIEKNSNLVDQILIEIDLLDKQILKTQEAFVEAASVGIRSKLFADRNLFSRMTNKFYFSMANDSVKWHKDKLIELQKKRFALKLRLEKLDGTFWINRFKRCLSLITIAIILALGIFFALSLIPLILTFFIIILVYSLSSKRKLNNF